MSSGGPSGLGLPPPKSAGSRPRTPSLPARMPVAVSGRMLRQKQAESPFPGARAAPSILPRPNPGTKPDAGRPAYRVSKAMASSSPLTVSGNIRSSVNSLTMAMEWPCAQ